MRQTLMYDNSYTVIDYQIQIKTMSNLQFLYCQLLNLTHK